MRYLALLATIALVVSIVGCGGNPKVPPDQEVAPPSSFPAVIEPSSPPIRQEVTVYITRTGAKYHRAGCRYLAKSMIPIDLGRAEARGYGPCSVCKPPE